MNDDLKHHGARTRFVLKLLLAAVATAVIINFINTLVE